MSDDDLSNRVRLQGMDILSDNHYILRNARFDYQRRDGSWQSLKRESYDIGHGAAVLPFDPARRIVLLVRQFRWPAFETGHRHALIEAPAGKLDGDDPETCARREAMEEAGVTLSNVKLVFHAFVSPGAVTERLWLFVGDYDFAEARKKGGGEAAEGEDIDVLEMPLDEAMALVADDKIIDAKTIMLLQAVKLNY